MANVSHEIKTPVTAIKVSVETLEEAGSDLPEPLRKFLRIIERHADRLAALVGDVLSISALESNSSEQGMRFSFQRERLLDILTTAKELCRSKAEAAGVALELECSPDLAVRADSSLLEQAVVNLIDNAVKYSPAGSSVTVSAVSRDGGSIEIRVTDHGCGIDKKEHERIFERFYRVDKARSRKLGGTGLGLSIVKHIVLAHGGTVHVESEPGKGATFVIELPPPGGRGCGAGILTRDSRFRTQTADGSGTTGPACRPTKKNGPPYLCEGYGARCFSGETEERYLYCGLSVRKGLAAKPSLLQRFTSPRY